MAGGTNDDATIISDDGHLVVQENLISVLRRIQKDQTAGFAAVTESLGSKADKADVSAIHARLDDHTSRLSSIESWRHDAELHRSIIKGRWSVRERVAGSIAALGVAIATFLAVFHH